MMDKSKLEDALRALETRRAEARARRERPSNPEEESEMERVMRVLSEARAAHYTFLITGRHSAEVELQYDVSLLTTYLFSPDGVALRNRLLEQRFQSIEDFLALPEGKNIIRNLKRAERERLALQKATARGDTETSSRTLSDRSSWRPPKGRKRGKYWPGQ